MLTAFLARPRVRHGRSGVWPPVPMPATAGLFDNQALFLARWVLAGAPSRRRALEAKECIP
jgi:cytochrome c551/c552